MRCVGNFPECEGGVYLVVRSSRLVIIPQSACVIAPTEDGASHTCPSHALSCEQCGKRLSLVYSGLSRSWHKILPRPTNLIRPCKAPRAKIIPRRVQTRRRLQV